MPKNHTAESLERVRDATFDAAYQAVRTLIEYMGDNPDREGLVETPGRVLRALEELGSGYAGKDPVEVLKTFADGAESCDEMVFQRNVPISSLCEHHMLPFVGVAHIGYIPDKRIVGLSKLYRLGDLFARKLQVQERLTSEIATTFQKALKPRGVGVMLACTHSCMECRGVNVLGTVTETTKLMGVFKKPEVKMEFLMRIK